MKLFHNGLIPGLYAQQRYHPIAFRMAISEFERSIRVVNAHWFLTPSSNRIQRNNAGTIGIRITYEKRDYRIPVRAIAYFLKHAKLKHNDRISYHSITCGKADCCNPAHIYDLRNPQKPIYSTRRLSRCRKLKDLRMIS
jgi:hypothetical protein